MTFLNIVWSHNTGGEASLMFIRLNLTWEQPDKALGHHRKPTMEQYFFLNWYFRVTEISYLNVKGGSLCQIYVGGFWDCLQDVLIESLCGRR